MDIATGVRAVEAWRALPESVRREVVARAEAGMAHPDRDVAAVAVAWARHDLTVEQRTFTRMRIVAAPAFVAFVIFPHWVLAPLIALAAVLAIGWALAAQRGLVGGPTARRVERANLEGLLMIEPEPAKRLDVTIGLSGRWRIELLCLACLSIGLTRDHRSWGEVVSLVLGAVGLLAWALWSRPPVRIDRSGLWLPRRHIPWAQVSHVTLKSEDSHTRARPAWVLLTGQSIDVNTDDMASPPEVALIATMSHGVPFRPTPRPAPPQPARVYVVPGQPAHVYVVPPGHPPQVHVVPGQPAHVYVVPPGQPPRVYVVPPRQRPQVYVVPAHPRPPRQPPLAVDVAPAPPANGPTTPSVRPAAPPNPHLL